MITHLARPKGDDGAEGVAGLRLQSAHLAEGSEHGDGEGTGRARLDLDLGHLQRAKGDVGEELSRSRARQPDRTLVLAGGLLASHVHVEVLEVLVETVLEETLEGVADEGGAETLPETLATLLSDDGPETADKTLVLGGVDLFQVMGVSDRTCQNIPKPPKQRKRGHHHHECASSNDGEGILLTSCRYLDRHDSPGEKMATAEGAVVGGLRSETDDCPTQRTSKQQINVSRCLPLRASRRARERHERFTRDQGGKAARKNTRKQKRSRTIHAQRRPDNQAATSLAKSWARWQCDEGNISWNTCSKWREGWNES